MKKAKIGKLPPRFTFILKFGNKSAADQVRLKLPPQLPTVSQKYRSPFELM